MCLTVSGIHEDAVFLNCRVISRKEVEDFQQRSSLLAFLIDEVTRTR